MDRISKLNAEVMRYYHSLLEKKGKEAKVFLNKIDIGEETIDNFNLGYSETDLNGLVYHFNSLGFDDFIFEMWQAEFDDNYEPEDVFLNRIIIPVIDDEDKVIGFLLKRQI